MVEIKCIAERVGKGVDERTLFHTLFLIVWILDYGYNMFIAIGWTAGK